LKQVVVLADGAEDIESARDFYEGLEPGVGEYCVDSLLIDIGSLAHFSGIHPLHFKFHRMLASRFHLAFTIESTGKRRRFLPSWICAGVRIGFVRN
jgi:hypothetical protein